MSAADLAAVVEQGKITVAQLQLWASVGDAESMQALGSLARRGSFERAASTALVALRQEFAPKMSDAYLQQSARELAGLIREKPSLQVYLDRRNDVIAVEARRILGAS